MFDLTGKSALIMAPGGIGGAIARALHGAALMLRYRERVKKPSALASELGENAHLTPANLSDANPSARWPRRRGDGKR